MDLQDEIHLIAEDDLVEQMHRLEALGVTLQEMPSPSTRLRTLVLVDRAGQILLACLVRLPVVEQVREMMTFYETAILSPQSTRH